jgi:glycosyltransferase involved in cell wall biosynthesis
VRRVLLVSEARAYGGAEVYLERLARGLPGWSAEVALPSRRELEPFRRRLAEAGVRTRPYAPGWVGAARMVRRARVDRPDLIHVNLPSTYDGGAGLLPFLLHLATRRPVVTTEHLTRIPRSRRRRLVKLGTAGGTAATVVVSRSSRDALAAEGLPADRIAVVPNGVPDPGPPRPFPPPQGPLRIGFLGTLEPRKQTDLLVQVLAALPELELRLEIGGDGPLRPALERLVERLGQTDRVAFHGAIADPYAFLGGVHLLALPSRLEGMPLSVLEGFAAGRGALVSDLPGMDEVVNEGTGRRLPLNDVATWSEAVREAFRDRTLPERWGEAARGRYEESFTLERVLDATVRVYDRVLAGERVA